MDIYSGVWERDMGKPYWYSVWCGVRSEWMDGWMEFERHDGVFRERGRNAYSEKESLLRVNELELLSSNRMDLKKRYLTARTASI